MRCPNSSAANDYSADLFSAPDLLHNFLVFLAGFRNHESQYLPPLAQKATAVFAARVHHLPFLDMDEEITGQDSRNIELQGSTYSQESEMQGPLTGDHSTVPPIETEDGLDIVGAEDMLCFR